MDWNQPLHGPLINSLTDLKTAHYKVTVLVNLADEPKHATDVCKLLL